MAMNNIKKEIQDWIKQVGPPFEDEYKKTDLLSMIFSFKKV